MIICNASSSIKTEFYTSFKLDSRYTNDIFVIKDEFANIFPMNTLYQFNFFIILALSNLHMYLLCAIEKDSFQ
jgi:hypothetical protein